MVVILLLVSCLVVPAGGSGESCNGNRCTDFTIADKQEGKRLIGFSLDSIFSGGGPPDCFVRCTLDCRCVSYNMRKTAPPECELNFDDDKAVGAVLSEAADFEYYRLATRPNQQVRTTLYDVLRVSRGGEKRCICHFDGLWHL